MPVGASSLLGRLQRVTFRPERFGQTFLGFTAVN